MLCRPNADIYIVGNKEPIRELQSRLKELKEVVSSLEITVQNSAVSDQVSLDTFTQQRLPPPPHPTPTSSRHIVEAGVVDGVDMSVVSAQLNATGAESQSILLRIALRYTGSKPTRWESSRH